MRFLLAILLCVSLGFAQPVRGLAGMDTLVFPSDGHNHAWQVLEPFPDCGMDCPSIEVIIQVWAPGALHIRGTAMFSGHLLDPAGRLLKVWDAEWDTTRGEPILVRPSSYRLEVWRWGQGFFDIYFLQDPAAIRRRGLISAPWRRHGFDLQGRATNRRRP